MTSDIMAFLASVRSIAWPETSQLYITKHTHEWLCFGFIVSLYTKLPVTCVNLSLVVVVKPGLPSCVFLLVVYYISHFVYWIDKTVDHSWEALHSFYGYKSTLSRSLHVIHTDATEEVINISSSFTILYKLTQSIVCKIYNLETWILELLILYRLALELRYTWIICKDLDMDLLVHTALHK